ncbi:MAG TPA: ABC transporter permease, partial [Longimicrobiales bacterium]|nr:ABC transporter permease [Longimicrobiales bacterium]
VLGHALWRDRFGSDPSILGRIVRLDGHPHTVVGVLPEGFRLRLPSFPGSDVELWKNPDTFWQNGDVWNARGPSFGLLRIVGRLSAGATLEEARSELGTVQADLRRRFPEYETAGLTLDAVPLAADLVEGIRPTLLLLMAAVGVVLFIACANVMGLLLVRAWERRRELAVRRALGASTARLFALLLSESAVLAGVGGGIGIALAVGGTRLLASLGPDLPPAAAATVNGHVLAFGLAVSVLVIFLVGLAPALGSARADPARRLRGPGSGADGSSAGLRSGLVVIQLALSLVLLVASGLLTSSLVRLRSVDPGFDPDGILTFSVSLPGTRYSWPDQSGRFFVELERRIEALAGVESVGVMWPVPLSGSRWMSSYTAGRVDAGAQAYADYRVGTAGYFETLGIPLLEGRFIGEGDPRESVVISRRIAQRSWPGESALGRTVRANPWGGEEVEFEVVGVVDDVRYA